MLIIAHHHIQNPDEFWSKAQALSAAMPSDLKLHSVFPSADMKTGTCLWEAPSVSDVQNFLDANVGDISENICYEVNQAASVGLPKMATEAVNN